MLAVVCVRDGVLPSGGAETVAECDGVALLVGTQTATAADGLAGVARELTAWETGGFAPGAWAAALAPALATYRAVVLPASPDGRDLAPRLAAALGRPLLAGALRVRPDGAELSRWGGLAIEDVGADGPFVATLQPGVRGTPAVSGPTPAIRTLDPAAGPGAPGAVADATSVAVLPPDVATMDLAEAPRILGGGAGVDSAERFALLGDVATALDASMGATRVITDRGWVPHSRQIGTTGVVVAPRVYVAFGVSGAVQHTSGLGQPEVIVSVNTDPSCPMMQLADVPIVADANATLDELAQRLGLR
jgi:electron transfer flavoprotein alpha subunit